MLTCKLLDLWRGFLDSLDSGGGHILVLCIAVCFGTAVFFKDPTAGGQMINLAFGALLTILTIKKSNRDQMGDTTTVAAVTTHTPPTDPAPVAPGPPSAA